MSQEATKAFWSLGLYQPTIMYPDCILTRIIRLVSHFWDYIHYVGGTYYCNRYVIYLFKFFRNLLPAENRFVACCSLGEGWHNYHHAFPFDYKAAEHFDFFNFTTKFIRLFAAIGWATDLKEATPQMIDSISKRLGDGTPIHFPLKTCEGEEPAAA